MLKEPENITLRGETFFYQWVVFQIKTEIEGERAKKSIYQIPNEMRWINSGQRLKN